MRNVWIGRSLALACLVAFPTGAFAATSTTNMNVNVTIASACTITVTDINFGTVAASSLVAAALTSTAANGGLLSYACGAAATPALTAGQGQNFTTTNRMKGTQGADFLPYTLNLPTLAAFTGNTQTAQITATIPVQAAAPTVDSYTDAVVLTLTY